MPFSRSFSVRRTYIFWLRSNCCGTSHNIYNSVCLSSTKPKKFCCHKQKTKQAPKTKQHSLLLSTVRKTVHGVVRVASFSKPLPSALMHIPVVAWREKEGSLQPRLWSLNSTSNSPVAFRRLSCQIYANQRKAETSANVNKNWQTCAKGNDVISNVLCASQHLSFSVLN